MVKGAPSVASASSVKIGAPSAAAESCENTSDPDSDFNDTDLVSGVGMVSSNEDAVTGDSSFNSSSLSAFAAGLSSSFRWSEEPEDVYEGNPEFSSPGGSVLLHQKLSSPSRKRAADVSARLSEEKQERASQARERHQFELAQKLRAQIEKVEAARHRREVQEKQKVESLTSKLQRAAEIREQHLADKRRKAQLEDLKVNEIAFINKLEAENKKMAVLNKLNESQERLNELEEERQRKALDKSAREDAVTARRQAIEAERAAQLADQEHRRVEREARCTEVRSSAAERRKEEKAGRYEQAERRRVELALALETGNKEFKAKLCARLEEAEQRKVTLLEQRKEAAASYSRPSSATGDGMRSDSATGNRDTGPFQESCASPGRLRKQNLADEIKRTAAAAAADERAWQTSAKKRMKKIRGRLEKSNIFGNISELKFDIESDFDGVGWVAKVVKGIRCWLELSKGKAAASGVLERHLATTSRMLASDHKSSPLTTTEASALLSTLFALFSHPSNQAPVISTKSLEHAARLIGTIIDNRVPERIIGSVIYAPPALVLKLIDRAVVGLDQGECTSSTTSGVCSQGQAVSVTSVLYSIISYVLRGAPEGVEIGAHRQWFGDALSYGVYSRLFHNTQNFLRTLPGTFDITTMSNPASSLTLQSLRLLLSFTDIPSPTQCKDVTSVVVSAMVDTEFAGTVSLLYSIVMRPVSAPDLDPDTARVTRMCIRVLNQVARLDISLLQNALDNGPLSLELGHVVLRLLIYCKERISPGHEHLKTLLHEIILLIGHLATGNKQYQLTMQSGGSSAVLPALCTLPFQYFSCPEDVEVLLPTLLALCHDSSYNTKVLMREVSGDLILDYLEMVLKRPIDEKHYDRFNCDHRFPRDLQLLSKEFFSLSVKSVKGNMKNDV